MYALTGNDDSSSSSSYPSGKNQLNRRNTREKKWWTTPQPWVKHFCGCNPPVPPVAKSKALTPTKNSSIDYMINAAAVFISKTQHVFKYAMLCIKPTAEHQFYAWDSSPKNKIVIIHVWTFRQNEMRIFMHLDPYNESECWLRLRHIKSQVLEQNEGEQITINYIFGWTVPLNHDCMG